MPTVDTEIPISDTNSFDCNFELDYGTPRSATFDSQGPALADQAHRAGTEAQLGPEASALGHSSLCFTFTVVWKLQLRKGRMMTLTGDTVEDVNVASGAFWSNTLKLELLAVVEEKAPHPQYKPDETRITVSTSKRSQHDFQKRFTGLNIDWNLVDSKLQSWSNQGNSLIVEIWFIYKENQLDTTNKVGKTGRGATNKQLAARDKLIAQQEASGVRPVWKDVYELFECSSAVCPNRGFSCWREPSDKRHIKLDSDTMEKLVDFAEEGNKLETHDDVPERIRELIYRHREEEETRKRLKRKASDPLPTTIHICCSDHQDKGSADSARNPQKAAGPARLKFPMPIDEAPKSYSDWLCSQVANNAWQGAYRLASQITIDKGYHLGRMYEAQAVDAKMLVTCGVLPGIALQFVGRVKEWLDELRLE
ncbi:hypothetical protein TARUN_8780 [Trichoderma arundinaceum]|uniref:Uncharacterized protein n=1 Tax=Trichoderma arundinaceum TaxID=490622 RepID=A0A395NBI5_TRIAR|nr:hypothetical protein TARUN_8780 [Trichoderma arundinaceum]